MKVILKAQVTDSTGKETGEEVEVSFQKSGYAEALCVSVVGAAAGTSLVFNFEEIQNAVNFLSPYNPAE